MSEKTIGPRTYKLAQPVVANSVRKPDAFGDVRVVTQKDLIEYEDLVARIERDKALLEERRSWIVDQLRAGWVLEPGQLVASVKPNFKRNVISWKQEFIDACGEAEAKKLEEAARGGSKEISSYSLEVRRTDGQK